eukprot:scaffold523_cov166-Amphora_coffeaeformis.AAC.5
METRYNSNESEKSFEGEEMARATTAATSVRISFVAPCPNFQSPTLQSVWFKPTRNAIISAKGLSEMIQAVATESSSIQTLRFNRMQRFDRDSHENTDVLPGTTTITNIITQASAKALGTMTSLRDVSIGSCDKSFLVEILHALQANPWLQTLRWNSKEFSIDEVHALTKFLSRSSSCTTVLLAGHLPPILVPTTAFNKSDLVFPHLQELVLHAHCYNHHTQPQTRPNHGLPVDDLVRWVDAAPAMESLTVLGWAWTSEHLDQLAHSSWCVRSRQNGDQRPERRRLKIINQARNEELSASAWRTLVKHVTDLHLQGFLFLSLDPVVVHEAFLHDTALESLTLQQCFLTTEHVVNIFQAVAAPDGRLRTLKKLNLVKEPSQMHWNRTVEPISPLIAHALSKVLSERTVSLELLSFDSVGTVNLEWKKRIVDSHHYSHHHHQYESKMWLTHQGALPDLLRHNLVFHEHIVSQRIRLGHDMEANIELRQGPPELFARIESMCRAQMETNTTMLWLVLEKCFPNTLHEYGAYMVGRNRVLSLLAPRAACWCSDSIWPVVLERLQRERNPSAYSAVFLALRDGVEKFRAP